MHAYMRCRRGSDTIMFHYLGPCHSAALTGRKTLFIVHPSTLLSKITSSSAICEAGVAHKTLPRAMSCPFAYHKV